MKPVDEVVETDVPAGNSLIELVEDEDAFLRDSWGSNEGVVSVQPGRVGLHSIDEFHHPMPHLRSFPAEPTDALPGQLGIWPVRFLTGRVEVWGGDADLGEVPLRLPQSRDRHYLMRVAVERKRVDEQEVSDYTLAHCERYGEPAHDLERFTIEFWPTS